MDENEIIAFVSQAYGTALGAALRVRVVSQGLSDEEARAIVAQWQIEIVRVLKEDFGA